MKIRPIKEGDAKGLSALHVKALPHTVSSQIGAYYLESIYRSVAKNKKNNCAFVAIESGRIIGAISATTNLKLFQSHVKRDLSIKNYLMILLAIITLRVSLLEILKRVQFENKLVENYMNNYATITILFVSKAQRRKGIGSKLTKKILKFYSKRDHIYVDTLLENKEAIRLYESLGFKLDMIIRDSAVLILNKK